MKNKIKFEAGDFVEVLGHDGTFLFSGECCAIEQEAIRIALETGESYFGDITIPLKQIEEVWSTVVVVYRFQSFLFTPLESLQEFAEQDQEQDQIEQIAADHKKRRRIYQHMKLAHDFLKANPPFTSVSAKSVVLRVEVSYGVKISESYVEAMLNLYVKVGWAKHDEKWRGARFEILALPTDLIQALRDNGLGFCHWTKEGYEFHQSSAICNCDFCKSIRGES